MKTLILTIFLLIPSLVFSANCTTANTSGAYSLETPTITPVPAGNEYLNHGFSGTLQLNSNGTASFTNVDAGGNGIVGSGAVWSVTAGCILFIDNMNFSNFVSGFSVANIVDNMDFRMRQSIANDDGVNRIVKRWVGNLKVQNTNVGNQWTGQTNFTINGTAVITKVLQ